MIRILEIIATLVVFGLALYGAWDLYRGTPAPAEIVRTDTVEVAAARPEPTPRPEPKTRIVYETRVDTVRDCFRLPTDFKAHGVMEQRPLSVTPSEVTIEYWQPEASRFEQAVYSVPTNDWRLWMDTGAALTPVGTIATGRLGITRKRWSLWGGLMAAQDEHLTLGWAAGISYRKTLFSW